MVILIFKKMKGKTKLKEETLDPKSTLSVNAAEKFV